MWEKVVDIYELIFLQNWNNQSFRLTITWREEHGDGDDMAHRAWHARGSCVVE